MPNMITVANREQLILLECALKGQMSDGHWENSKPRGHWKDPCAAKVVIGPKPHINFGVERRYNFASPELLAAVGEDMLRLVMFARKYQGLSPAAVSFAVNENGEWAWDAEKHPYYNKVKAELAAVGLNNKAEIDDAVRNLTGYTMKDLRKDLKAIKEAFDIFTPFGR